MSLKIGCGARSLDMGLPSFGTVTFIAASIGVVSFPVMIRARGFCAFIVSTCSGENEAMKSISPALNAAISVIKDPITEMAAFKAGEIDFIASFSPEHVDTMKAQNPRAQIMTGKETTPMLAAMKVTVPKDGKPMSKDRAPHPIFSDIRVRKAVGCYGIDRKEIVKIAFKGQATPWVRIIPPGTMDTVDVTSMCPYDQAKAKALLAEAGYGPQKPLTFELMTNTEKSVFNVIATVIKEQMSRIGVTANIRLVDKPSWMTTATLDGVFDMYVEDLASLLTVDQNSYLSASSAA